ncbi:hypothetical protein [Telluribacter humicola]|uniref:hypothetical protein n=1 Tax=Telluribacter humicola TaxID=1720261 RepID=UPI001A95B848|nr:hypothetical protein [Telluribacter humicola]
MKNILTTIPKSKFRDWPTCERVLQRCDGLTDLNGNGEWFWLINTKALPKDSGTGAVCYMIYDGLIRGYMDIVDTDISENWRDAHDIGKPRTTKCLVMANWHPITPQPHTGFQGYRYTQLKP